MRLAQSVALGCLACYCAVRMSLLSRIAAGCASRCPCRAKNSAGGVPQAVTCQVTLASSNLPADFSAQAFQGAVSSPQPTTLRSGPAEFFT